MKQNIAAALVVLGLAVSPSIPAIIELVLVLR